MSKVHTCKKHGFLSEENIVFNRISPKGKIYYRCRICRNANANLQLYRTIYIKTPKKHIKTKLPKFIAKEYKSHAYTILHRFKLSDEKYYELLKKQNHVCHICKKPETQIKRKSNKVKMLSVDHCH